MKLIVVKNIDYKWRIVDLEFCVDDDEDEVWF